MDWLDFVFPVLAIIGITLGSYFRPITKEKHIHVDTAKPLTETRPGTAEKRSLAYSIGYAFQKQMLVTTPVQTNIDTFIDELTNPQGRYADAADWDEFKKSNEGMFRDFKSWANFKKTATPQQVEEFNEGRQEATAEHYRGLANEMAFNNALERSDSQITSMQKGLDEVYLTHHKTIDAHEIWEKALETIDKEKK